MDRETQGWCCYEPGLCINNDEVIRLVQTGSAFLEMSIAAVALRDSDALPEISAYTKYGRNVGKRTPNLVPAFVI